MRLVLLPLFVLSLSLAAPAFAKTDLPVPRFVTIKASEANIRTGPNVRYPVKWVFVKKGEPVEVVAEFEQWRKIRDKNGDDGWIHESILSGKRMAIITGNTAQIIYSKPDYASVPEAKIEPEVRVELHACKKDWCRIASQGFKGWLERKFLWGAYPTEEFD